MFIYNVKVSGTKLSKCLFVIIAIVILIIFSISIYNIFFRDKNSNQVLTISDTIDSNTIFEISTNNYTNILKAANDDIDSYVGSKFRFTGYVYRLLDFDDNQFVLARDMIISSDNQSLVVGFLCSYEKAKDFADGTWVEITGEITKGDYHGDIALVKVLEMNQVEEPKDLYVYPPSDTYVPTSNMF